MKKILYSLLLILLYSCDIKNGVKQHSIMTKYYKKDKPCICEYQYRMGMDYNVTEDSCNKYSVGDIMPFK